MINDLRLSLAKTYKDANKKIPKNLCNYVLSMDNDDIEISLLKHYIINQKKKIKKGGL